MSGWKTNLMAQASRQYIEGVTNTPNSTFTIHLRFYGDGDFNTYTVPTDGNGYWRWYNTTGKRIYSLGSFVTNSNLPAGTAQSLLSVRFSDNFDWRNNVTLDQAFGSSANCAENVKSITNIAATYGTALCLQRAFQNCFALEDLDVSKIKLQSTTTDLDLYYTFDSCQSLEEIKGFNELVRQKPISRLYWTFDECYKLKEIDFRGATYIGTRGTNNFTGLFQDCWSLERIYNLDIIFGLQTSMSSMFRRCFSLISNENETIDLSTIDMSNMTISTSSTTGIYQLFYSATADMTNWETKNPGKRAFENITHIGLPAYPEGMKNGNEWLMLRNLTTIVACGDIHTPALSNNNAIITFQNSPLTLDSAKLIMSKVKQATAGSTSILTFRSSTLALIQSSINNGDADTISAVTNAIDNGWTITGLNLIYGQAIQVNGVYPATISARINNNILDIDVNQQTGYWIWEGSITSLYQCLFESAEIEKIKVYNRNQASVSQFQFARRSQTIKEIDCQGLETNNLNFAFGLTANDYSNGYRSSLISIYLPIIRNGITDANNCLRYTNVLTDVRADYIEASLTLSESPLTLHSAINILNALQDVTSYGGATLTFSSTTKGYINNDQDALALVANAVNNLGWTIALT